jgi:PiT family inorganic phosphate transporter
MGLIMLILIGILPGVYAINPTLTTAGVATLVSENKSVQPFLDAKAGPSAPITGHDAETALSDFLKYGAKAAQTTFVALAYENRAIAQIVGTAATFDKLTDDQRKDLRTKSYLVGESIGKLTKPNKAFTAPGEAKELGDYKKQLDGMTKFIPVWVKFMVALCLGIGTMIGWKRIVVTIGEKIGKSHLTYAQGASAELVTMATIQGADMLGLPVSTTHILSSGVAGTMAANGSGLQARTLRNIVLAWVLTVPVTVFLGALIFGAGFLIVLRFFGA